VEMKSTTNSVKGGREGGRTYHLIRLSIRALVPKSQEEDTVLFWSACLLEGAADVVEDLCFHVPDSLFDELLWGGREGGREGRQE